VITPSVWGRLVIGERHSGLLAPLREDLPELLVTAGVIPTQITGVILSEVCPERSEWVERSPLSRAEILRQAQDDIKF
jgi:hypothetical protein